MSLRKFFFHRHKLTEEEKEPELEELPEITLEEYLASIENSTDN